MRSLSMRRLVLICATFLTTLAARPQAPMPASVLGHTPGDDYYLANYEEEIHYFHELAAHSERMTALAFRPSGTWLVSAARDRRLLLWRVGSASEPQDAHLLTDDCTLLRFSRDGRRLAVGDARGGITVYDCTP